MHVKVQVATHCAGMNVVVELLLTVLELLLTISVTVTNNKMSEKHV